MKAIKLTHMLAGVLALTMIVTGCQKRPQGITPLKDRTTVIHPGEPFEGTMVNPGGEKPFSDTLGTEQKPKDFIAKGNFTEDPAALAAHVVHFDYDSSVIKSSEQANVDAVAAYLKNDPNVGLRIDGHCDERGTEGYNDALGERRASALREAVLGLGVEADRVITQSFGERKPAASGHDESAYAQNRRGEFIVLHQK
jgi:peptidoglycan-associated lipoprotein